MARALSGSRSGKLGRVDTYGDTMFDEQEAQAAREQVVVLLQACPDPAQAAALRDLAEMLEACATTPGSYLWFMGD